jgi:hypothetical protein
LSVHELARSFIALLDSVLLPRSCAYVVGPLASGLAHYEALSAGLDVSPLRRKNEERFQAFSEHLRANLACPVFNPAILRVAGWSDAEHGLFFLDVIEKYAREAWLLDGWEYSRGATKEFIHCAMLGITCRDEQGGIVGPEEGRVRINEAVSHVEALGLDASKLRARLL